MHDQDNTTNTLFSQHSSQRTMDHYIDSSAGNTNRMIDDDNNFDDDDDAILEEEGWGNDLDTLLDDDDTDDDDGGSGIMAAVPPVCDLPMDEFDSDGRQQQQQQQQMEYARGAITPIITNRQKTVVLLQQQQQRPIAPDTTGDGWDDDDDTLDLDVVDDVETTKLEVPHPPVSERKLRMTPLELDVQDYIQSIPTLMANTNVHLQNEYNTVEKAVELQQYYISRPQLLQYTIDKELPRMDYTLLRTAHEGADAAKNDDSTYQKEVIRDKSHMARILQASETSSQLQPSSLCGRCANQSILVDILQAMSTTAGTSNSNSSTSGPLPPPPPPPSRAILPSQFMSTAIATYCHFTMDISISTVHVVTHFNLSLPMQHSSSSSSSSSSNNNSHQERWNIGQIHATVLFHCPVGPTEVPRVEFRLVDFIPFVVPTDPEWGDHIRQCAAMLQELQLPDDSHEWMMPPSSSSSSSSVPTTPAAAVFGGHSSGMHGNFRDAFVQRQLLSVVTTDAVHGMKSAWQDLDTATGLVTKFKNLPFLLPSVVPMEYDDDDDDDPDTKHSTRQPVMPHKNTSSYQTGPPPPPPRPPPSKSRPTSILGGLVRSIAQSVTLPEEDPNMYQEWKQNQPPNNSRLPHFGPSLPPEGRSSNMVVPRLYNAEPISQSVVVGDSSSINSSAEHFPRLYQRSNHLHSSDQEQPQLHVNRSSELSATAMLHSKTTTTTMTVTRTDKVPIPENEVPEEGWDDPDDDLDDLLLNDVENESVLDSKQLITTAAASTTKTKVVPKHKDAHAVAVQNVSESSSSLLEWKYDPITDIVPTRTRWRNPISGSRDLRFM
jgi:hypothetical protein